MSSTSGTFSEHDLSGSSCSELLATTSTRRGPDQRRRRILAGGSSSTDEGGTRTANGRRCVRAYLHPQQTARVWFVNASGTALQLFWLDQSGGSSSCSPADAVPRLFAKCEPHSKVLVDTFVGHSWRIRPEAGETDSDWFTTYVVTKRKSTCLFRSLSSSRSEGGGVGTETGASPGRVEAVKRPDESEAPDAAVERAAPPSRPPQEGGQLQEQDEAAAAVELIARRRPEDADRRGVECDALQMGLLDLTENVNGNGRGPHPDAASLALDRARRGGALHLQLVQTTQNARLVRADEAADDGGATNPTENPFADEEGRGDLCPVRARPAPRENAQDDGKKNPDTSGAVHARGSLSFCRFCNKKMKLHAYTCRCGHAFCIRHKDAEEHGCTFDYLGEGRKFLAAQNPRTIGDQFSAIGGRKLK